MAFRLLIEREYQSLFTVPSVQVILCSYCTLRNWEHDDLAAPYWRWYWNDTRGAVISSGGRRIELGPDRVVLIPPETHFSTDTRNLVGHLHFHFLAGVRLVAAERKPIVRRVKEVDRVMIGKLVAMMQLPPSRQRGDWSISCGVHALIGYALAQFPVSAWEMEPVDRQIASALAAMHERPNHGFSNVDLARLASLSPNAFLRRFRVVTGVTPHRYLTRLRVDRAGLDLLNTGDSIEAIALRNGFCDRYHLSRVFKQVLGRSPSEYRRRGQRLSTAAR